MFMKIQIPKGRISVRIYPHFEGLCITSSIRPLKCNISLYIQNSSPWITCTFLLYISSHIKQFKLNQNVYTRNAQISSAQFSEYYSETTVYQVRGK